MSRSSFPGGRDTIQSLMPAEFDDVTPTMPPTPSTPSEVGRIYVAPTSLPPASDPEIEPESIKLARDIDPRKVTTKRKMGRATPSYAPPDLERVEPIVWRSRRVPPLAWISGTLMFVGAVGLLAWPRVKSDSPATEQPSRVTNAEAPASAPAATVAAASSAKAADPAPVSSSKAAPAGSDASNAPARSATTANAKPVSSTLSASRSGSSVNSYKNQLSTTAAPKTTGNSNVGNMEKVVGESPKRRQMIY